MKVILLLEMVENGLLVPVVFVPGVHSERKGGRGEGGRGERREREINN